MMRFQIKACLLMSCFDSFDDDDGDDEFMCLDCSYLTKFGRWKFERNIATCNDPIPVDHFFYHTLC